MKLDFVAGIKENLMGGLSAIAGGLGATLVDLLKYHKHRINWENYKIVLNEDAPLQETLTEDTIEVLENQD